MRVLILSCNTGQGHNSAAAAIKEVMTENGIVCDVSDVLSFISENISDLISGWHSRIYRYMPGVFRWGYNYAENHRGVFNPDSCVYRFLTRGVDRLYEFCCSGEYDAIICAHVFSGLIVTSMCEKHSCRVPTYFVATDYTCSPSTEQGRMNRYFIPSEALIQEFVKCSIAAESIVASGIPIREAFFNKVPKKIAKQAFNIPIDRQHLLMMCGSMGCGPIEKTVKLFSQRLWENQELTVVCGTNKRLYEKLARRFSSNSHIHVLGYTERIALLMASADLYLTKPGGISVTEAAAVGLPMVFINAVAGCEEYNMHYFIQRGAAVTAKTPKALAELSLNLLSDSAALERMGNASCNACPGNGAQVILKTVSEAIRQEDNR